jgi:Ca2+-binding RTX toxin-like protein
VAIFNGTSAGDTLNGGAEDDTLNGLAGDDFLYGNAGNDTLNGGEGDDQLFGGPGNDTIDGGSGALDYARYDNANGAVNVNLALGTASGADGVDSLLNLDGVTGSAFADTLVGSANNDFIEGGLGNDYLDGGLGVDYLGHQLATGSVTVSLASGATAGAAGNDVLLGFENVGGSPFNDFLTGNTGNNILEGMAGDDVLDGGNGGDGASYYHAGGGVTVTLNQGATPGDANGADGHDVLLNMENVYGSQYADTLVGNSASNYINGYDGDDVIDGAGGADTLVGGLGRERFVVRPLDGAVITITDFQVGVKADGLDVSQLLADSAAGAAYSYNSDPFAKGILRVQQSSGNTLLQWDADGSGPKEWQTLAILENVTAATLVAQNFIGVPVLGGDQADTLLGDIWSDVIIAGGGDDTLDGGGGADRMEGGKGADTYFVDNLADLVLEADNAAAQAPDARPGLDLGSAIDKVVASVTFSLTAFVENLDLAAGAGDLAGSGNALDNTLLGNDGRNNLTGAGGNDHIDGGAGVDTALYSGGRAGYVLNRTSTGFTVTDTSGLEGSDTLQNVERFKFAGAGIAFDMGLAQSGGGTALLIGAVLGQATLAAKKELVAVVIDLFDQGFTLQQLSGAVMRLDIWTLLAGGNEASQIASYLLTMVRGTAPDAATLTAAVASLTNDPQGDFLWHLAESSDNQTQVGLVGLAATGLEFQS